MPSRKQISLLISRCQEDTPEVLGVRDAALIATLATTGLRASELCSLRVEDINMRTRQAPVVGNLTQPRMVSFDPAALRALREYWRLAKVTEGAAFRDRSGKPLSTAALYLCIRRRGNEIGLTNLRPGKLRRSWKELLSQRIAAREARRRQRKEPTEMKFQCRPEYTNENLGEFLPVYSGRQNRHRDARDMKIIRCCLGHLIEVDGDDRKARILAGQDMPEFSDSVIYNAFRPWCVAHQADVIPSTNGHKKNSSEAAPPVAAMYNEVRKTEGRLNAFIIATEQRLMDLETWATDPEGHQHPFVAGLSTEGSR